MKTIYIISDDLTGACDTGAYLCDCASPVRVSLSRDRRCDFTDFASNSVQIYNTHTRTIASAQASEILSTLGNSLQHNPDRLIIKKMDTGYRGNPAVEINALMDALSIELCFIVNSIPEINTVTVGGMQFIHGTLLEESIFASDPVNEVTDSHVSTILQRGSKRQVGWVSLESIRQGALLNSVQSQIEKGKRLLVFDSCSEADIREVLDVLFHRYPDALWGGSLGLIKCMSNKLFGEQKGSCTTAQTVSEPEQGRVIGFTTSRQAITAIQLAKAERDGLLKVVDIEMDALLDNTAFEEKLEEVITRVKEILNFSNVFLRSLKISVKDYQDIEKKIPHIVGIIAARICEEVEFDKLVLVGGDTAFSVLSALDTSTIELGYRIEEAIACGVILDGKLAGKKLAIKGGAVGSEDAISKMIKL